MPNWVWALVAILLIAAGGGATWYALGGKKTKLLSYFPYDMLDTEDVQSVNKPGPSRNPDDESRFTLMAAISIQRFQATEFPKFILQWGPLVVMLEKDSNNMFIGLNSSPTVTDPAQGSTGGTVVSGLAPSGTGTVATNAGQDYTAAALVYGNLNDNYCLFEVQDCPFYRTFVLHLVYSFNNRMMRVYIDGKLIKSCNLFTCKKTTARFPMSPPPSVNVRPTMIVSYAGSAAPPTFTWAASWADDIQVHKLAISSSERSKYQVESDAAAALRIRAKKLRASGKPNTCP